MSVCNKLTDMAICSHNNGKWLEIFREIHVREKLAGISTMLDVS